MKFKTEFEKNEGRIREIMDREEAYSKIVVVPATVTAESAALNNSPFYYLSKRWPPIVNLNSNSFFSF